MRSPSASVPPKNVRISKPEERQLVEALPQASDAAIADDNNADKAREAQLTSPDDARTSRASSPSPSRPPASMAPTSPVWSLSRARVLFWGKRLAIVAGVFSVIGLVLVVILIRHFEEDLPSVADLKGNYHPPQVTRVLARDGTLLAELFTERRTVVSIAQLPAHLKLAVLAAEDAGFYEHEGLDYFGILRAFVVNLRAGRTRQGGSTITQQVVKNLLLDSGRTYKRKIREALLSRRLEQELTKDEILELYLNHIYFGHGRYGIEEASRDNFGKSAKELTVGEGALLAGLVAGPETYSPRKDAKKAALRREFVLAQMRAKGFLNDTQLAAATKEPLHISAVVEVHAELAPEAIEIARKLVAELDPERSKRGGFTITTTIDPRLQAAARKAVRDNLIAYDKRHGLQGALKAPPPATDRKGRPLKLPPASTPFDGTPLFESHKILNGVVVGADDALGVVDVRVGTALGVIRLSDYDRYNPAHLTPTAFAPLGAIVRVSLLAPVTEVALALPSTATASASASDDGGALALATTVPTKAPLRLESGPESALVAIDVRSRGVLALVGNYEAVSGMLDRATQARRQPGSTFKPVVYSYALHSRRYTPATLVDVNPESFDGGYKPSNYEGWTGKDPLRLREALANSVNVVAVRVLQDVGPANVVSWGQSLGIRSVLKPDLSLALGSYEIHPIELCGAYATFAAGGMYDEPHLVTRIVGPDGKDVPLKPLPPARRVLDEAEAYVMTSMLTSVVDHGTATRARSLARPVAGKTGTSNSAKDTWFSGYSTEIAATAWVGFDDGKSLGNETGGSTALPAWVNFMKVAHEQKPPSEFPKPPGVVSAKIDTHSGKIPYEGDPDVMDEIFLAGTEPTEVTDFPAPDAGATTAEGAPAATEATEATDSEER
jgi:penicillin-binding protein 1A